MKSVGLLIGVTLLAWAVAALAGRALSDDLALWHSAAAMLLCLVPSVATLAWVLHTYKGQPEQQLLAVMGGTVVRMAVAVGGGIALYNLREEFHYQRFWLWVIGFYLFTLALEVMLLTRKAAADEAAKK